MEILLYFGLCFGVASSPPNMYCFQQQHVVEKPIIHDACWRDSDGGWRPAGVR